MRNVKKWTIISILTIWKTCDDVNKFLNVEKYVIHYGLVMQMFY